ncbi:MAG: hypothetical protein AB2693_20540 [Candidatus Thiodiazotropha sp.]
MLNKLLSNATKDVRPGLDEAGPLIVNVSLNLVALTELNEVKGYISTIGFLDVSWIDERMAWDPADYEGISSVSIESSKVWTPDIITSNPAEKIHSFSEISTGIRYFSTGFAWWRPGSVIKTICFIRIPAYPFDVHTCPISFAAWGTFPFELILQTPTNTVTTSFYSENSEWALTGTSAGAAVAGDQLSMVGFDIQFSRKSTFLVVNILIPIVFLSILNSVVFLLPQESGERVSFSVTVLLSFTVFLSVIGDNIPKTSSPMPLLCHYVVAVLIYSGIITFTAILCQRLYHTRGMEPVPIWLLTCLCMQSPTCVNKVENLPENEEKVLPKNEDTVTSHEAVSWKYVILKLDKILFVFFFILAIALSLGFILTMALTVA